MWYLDVGSNSGTAALIKLTTECYTYPSHRDEDRSESYFPSWELSSSMDHMQTLQKRKLCKRAVSWQGKSPRTFRTELLRLCGASESPPLGKWEVRVCEMQIPNLYPFSRPWHPCISCRWSLNHTINTLIVGKGGCNNRHQPKSLLMIVTRSHFFLGVTSVACIANMLMVSEGNGCISQMSWLSK